MEEQRLKRAVRHIAMPEEMRRRVARRAGEEAGTRRTMRWKKPLLLAAALCLLAATPVLAVRVEPMYELFYALAPEAAQRFKPVQKWDEDQGIRMEVVSADLHGDTAEIYLTLQDLTGNRVDDTTDLYDSYALHTPFDASAHCEQTGYDPETGTAAFLITLTHMEGQRVEGKKLTFSLREFLSQKVSWEGLELPLMVGELPRDGATWPVELLGGSGLGYDEASFAALVPGETEVELPVDGVTCTAAGFVGEELHIQLYYRDHLERDAHGWLWLENQAGEQIECDASYTFMEETEGQRRDYTEYVFAVSPEQAAEYQICGDFETAGCLTQGSWSVTFSLEN